jgi:glycerol-3-phosphate acyltransferase PlsX
VLIGDEEVIVRELEKNGRNASDFEIVHAAESIEMAAHPVKAIAQSPHSSINIGVQLVKSGQLDGFVSAGNTGAMLVASIFGLGKIDGVARPTIGSLFPNAKGGITLLCDVGANVDCKPEALYHFGILGSVYVKSMLNVENPRVALLNVGEEDTKGPNVVQQAFQLMKDSPLINFVGNMEGRDVYHGKAEIYVCDGFTGNIVLKFAESLYDAFKTRFTGDPVMETFNFENYGGVPVLGINGIVIIGHGISTPKAIANMIHQAVSAAQTGLVKKVKEAFESLHLED